MERYKCRTKQSINQPVPVPGVGLLPIIVHNEQDCVPGVGTLEADYAMWNSKTELVICFQGRHTKQS